MQNLINFIWKYHFAFLFLILELLSFALLVKFNKYQNSGFLAKSNEISGNIYAAVTNATSYLELRKINEKLSKDNARLLSQAEQSFARMSDSTMHINDSVYKQKYTYLGAKVINSTVNHRNNFVILDQGKNQGIEPEMGVVNVTGVVGVVRTVSDNFCSVLSLLHTDSKTSVKLQNEHYFGLLTWEETNNSREATLSDIPSHVGIGVGDTVVTRGSTGMFPEGIPVGTIKEFEIIPGSDFFEITIKLSADFHSLSYCYVIKNILRQEQLELEAEFSDD